RRQHCGRRRCECAAGRSHAAGGGKLARRQSHADQEHAVRHAQGPSGSYDSSMPAKSVPELIALLKQKPGEITFTHSGAGAAIFLAAELFQRMTGTKMNGVAYRGAPPALNDVIAGHVSLMFADAGSVVGHINAGRVRALGVSSTSRVPA